MAKGKELADRVRESLDESPSLREVRMFGGLCFMVNERMVVSVRKDGELLVRADPERVGDLLTVKGAQPAEMGAGRVMGGGWIAVSEEAIATDEDLGFWMGEALRYNDKA